jgi:prenyltransferase beta subunit
MLMKNKLTTLADGGFSMGGTTADPDVTAMALQALAPYKGQNDIKTVIDRALDCLSRLQNSDGGYSSGGLDNSESAVQVLVALTALGINPDTDTRFIKHGLHS